MRFARLVALLLGVGLIVAAGAGFLARSAELERERDLRVRNAADAAAAGIEAVTDQVEVVAGLATEPAGAVAALATRDLAACATASGGGTEATVVCGTAVTDAAADRSAAVLRSLEERAPTLVADDGVVIVTAGGADVAVAAVLPQAVLDHAGLDRAGLDRTGEPVEVALVPSPEVPTGTTTGVTTDGDRRFAGSTLDPIPGWTVVASTADDTGLPQNERNLMLVGAIGGVLLLVLAGITLVAQQRRLVERASIDPLTKLPNRSELETRGEAMIQLARRSEQGVCVMLVDLDGFKAVNDTLGHAVGDEVLRVVGMRLRSAVRGYDLVARWGGDEFVLVLPGIDNDTFANSRASSLAELVAQPMRADDGDVGVSASPQVGASIGISLLGRHGETLEELVAAADAAMYSAKRNGSSHAIAETPTLAPCSPVNH